MHNTPSPQTGDAAIEQDIRALGKTVPRITMARLEDHIASEYYFTAGEAIAYNHGGPVVSPEPSTELLTICVLVLRNGFTVTGESACADPGLFDMVIGRKIARENAVQKMWPLFGFMLKDSLAPAEQRVDLPK